MPALQPYLLAGLRLFEAFEVCRVSVGIVGDLTRSLEIKIQPYTRDIMDVLVASLKDPSLDRSVKPIVLSCFGEIAMALNEHFEPYVQACLMLLMQASGMEAPQDDDDMIDYINELRGSVLEAYTGIVTGLNDGNRLDLLSSYLPALVQFLQRIAADPNRDAAIIKSAAGLIGDIAKPYGKQIKEQIHQPFIGQLLNEAAQARDPDTVAIANWAMSEVQNIIQ
jgi:importin subunit beta-1